MILKKMINSLRALRSVLFSFKRKSWTPPPPQVIEEETLENVLRNFYSRD